VVDQALRRELIGEQNINTRRSFPSEVVGQGEENAWPGMDKKRT
jgi:hypothetical protein